MKIARSLLRNYQYELLTARTESDETGINIKLLHKFTFRNFQRKQSWKCTSQRSREAAMILLKLRVGNYREEYDEIASKPQLSRKLLEIVKSHLGK